MQLRNLTVYDYGNGVTVWGYRTPDITEVFVPGFFDDASTSLSCLDHIHIHGENGGALVQVMSVIDGRVNVLCLARGMVEV